MNDIWTDKIRTHYQNYFVYDPVDVRAFRRDKLLPQIQVLKYRNVFEGCTVLATVGLSFYSEAINKVTEVYLPVEPDVEIAPMLLANSLFFIIANQMHFGWGIGITFDDIFPDFAKDCGKTAIYFTNVFGLPEEFAKINLGTAEAHMYAAFLISRKEYEYFQTTGAIALEKMFKENDADVMDVYRNSCL